MVDQTLNISKLGSLKIGDRVNLERAMKAGDRLDGHVVQGHVEGVGRVVSMKVGGSDGSDASIPRPLPPEEEGEIRRKWPLNTMIKTFARAMRKKPTTAEAALWQAIRYDQLGVRFRRQYPIGGRILDFYCPALHLAIEVDGSIHQESFQLQEDVLRDEYLKEDLHVTTLRVTNDAVLGDLENVLEMIKKTITKHSPPPSEEGLGVEAVGASATKAILLQISLPPDLVKNILPKGSITLDGVSLTIASIEGNLCSIALIPHTIEHTTLGLLRVGDSVNIETDVYVRSVAAMLSSRA